MEERILTTRPICLPEEDPQIPCSVCDVIDCMIHNSRHQYCMNYGQRLLGLHACTNEREHLEPPIVQHPVPVELLDQKGELNLLKEELIFLETPYYYLKTLM